MMAAMDLGSTAHQPIQTIVNTMDAGRERNDKHATTAIHNIRMYSGGHNSDMLACMWYHECKRRGTMGRTDA